MGNVHRLDQFWKVESVSSTSDVPRIVIHQTSGLRPAVTVIWRRAVLTAASLSIHSRVPDVPGVLRRLPDSGRMRESHFVPWVWCTHRAGRSCGGCVGLSGLLPTILRVGWCGERSRLKPTAPFWTAFGHVGSGWPWFHVSSRSNPGKFRLCRWQGCRPVSHGRSERSHGRSERPLLR
jgi:hypothetical protein